MAQVEFFTSAEDALFGEGGWDAVLVVSQEFALESHPELAQLVSHAASVDQRTGKEATLLLAPGLAGGRLLLAPTGDLSDDYEDVRRVYEAAEEGAKMAFRAGARAMLLLLDLPAGDPRYLNAAEVAALGVAQGLYLNPDVESQPRVRIGLMNGQDVVRLNALEAGRVAARDLCGGDPEQMAPPAFADYCVSLFAEEPVELSVIDDRQQLEREYPLLSAVSRASFNIARHAARVVRIDYNPEGEIHQTWLIAGKGVTFDTGGADLKVGGAMAGMSRDKGGAAAAAGFMKAVAMLRPQGIRVVAELGLVRNAAGSDAFVPDEIITSHAGIRVRIGNTDAEGRLVLADLLSHLREAAQGSPAPRVFSLATLTGHVVRAYGPYTGVVENSVARVSQQGQLMQQIGERWGEPVELSTLRREDFAQVAPRSESEDLLSSNNGASVNISRGHQFPQAFLLKASGLDRHQLASDLPIPYLHVDIAAAAVEKRDPLYGKPTARPVATLLAMMEEL
ncbi:leucyl aminopeptidase family protein [Ferrimonas sediminicola]|uniref:Leucyl aminopeptidase family protein n=1 Tax=Ferrimonas sediminicola TaxID=2569538 RepID=A0A4U1BFK7_9GAMM|nr:leucyl aminopeptidase family protein [Ferrimonas sediminicola]TKB49713.1 leucyl aminopeptidase family protein [Ferrimonas sediminicola]